MQATHDYVISTTTYLVFGDTNKKKKKAGHQDTTQYQYLVQQYVLRADLNIEWILRF